MLIKYYDRLLDLCDYQLNQAIEDGLRAKYLWLKKKVDQAVNRHDHVSDYFKKREEEKREQWLREYNDKFSIYPQQLEVKIVTKY